MMKALGTLFVVLMATIQGYSHLEEKTYLDPSKLYFAEEGIFLNTGFDEWTQVDHIGYDAQGYYLPNQYSAWQGDPIVQPKQWKCPYCGHWWFIGEKCKNPECATNQW